MNGRKVIIVDEEVRLMVKIFGTIGVTDGRPWQYKVTVWTNSNNERETREVPCEGDPEFNEEIQIPQDENSPAEYLYIKVSRKNIESEEGFFLVGNAQVRLPPINEQDFYVEVKLSGGPHETGFLQLSMYLMNFEILGYAPQAS